MIPRLFDNKGAHDSIRVWSVGCATGEEAYSLAMLLLEEAGRRDAYPQLQIFASDLHGRSLQTAREGFYPGSIDADVSPARLKRFFQVEAGGYRIRKEVRELAVFAPHNLLGDPPFSRLDFICCRNLLIYLDRDVQRAVIELFHYALEFRTVSCCWAPPKPWSPRTCSVSTTRNCVSTGNAMFPRPNPDYQSFHSPGREFPGETNVSTAGPAEPVGFGSLHQRMVEMYAPPSLLISPDNKLVHVSEACRTFPASSRWRADRQYFQARPGRTAD